MKWYSSNYHSVYSQYNQYNQSNQSNQKNHSKEDKHNDLTKPLLEEDELSLSVTINPNTSQSQHYLCSVLIEQIIRTVCKTDISLKPY